MDRNPRPLAKMMSASPSSRDSSSEGTIDRMMDFANGRSVDDEGVVAEEEEGPASLVRSTGVARAREDEDDEREDRRGEGAGAITGVGGC